MKKKLVILLMAACLSVPVIATETGSECNLYNYVLQQDKNVKVNETLRNDLYNLYHTQLTNREYTKAIKTIDCILKVSEKLYGKNSLPVIYAKLDRADVNNALQMSKEAFNGYSEVYKYAVKKGKKELETRSLYGLANISDNIKQYNKEIEFYNKLSKNNLNTNDYYNLSKAYINICEPQKAFELIEQGYNSIENPTNDDKFLYYYTLADAYKDIGYYNKALDNLAKSELFAVNSENKYLVLRALLTKTDIYRQLEMFDVASQINEQIQKYYDENDLKSETESLYKNYLDYYKDIKDCSNFEKYYKKSVELFNDYPEISLKKIDLAEKKIQLLQEIKNINEAEELTNETLRKLSNIKDFAPAYYGNFLTLAAENERKKDNTDSARKYFEETLIYYKKAYPVNVYEYENFYFEYAQLYRSQGNNQEAINYFNKALEYAKKALVCSHAADVQKELAKMYKSMNNEETAKKYTNEAIENYSKSYGKNHSRTYNQMLEKYYIYREFSSYEDAQYLLDEINNDVKKFGITGKEKEAYKNINIANGYAALHQKKYRQALKYAKIAEKNILNDNDRHHVYQLFYYIYNAKNKQAKAEKYKKMSEI